MDLAIREFTTQIVNYINSSALPIEIKRLIIKDIYNQVEIKANEIVMQAIQERNEKINKSNEEIIEDAKGVTE